ncbi:MAG: protease SohB [Cellvibrionales bacterium TMED49]|nr:protease SohB [Porticoccaceae bacterium]OUU37008.1 MAG: protease SohB [Cellvibrionales bacterium TMED49]
MEFLYDYGLFFAKLVTFALILLSVTALISLLRNKRAGSGKGDLMVTRLNDLYEDTSNLMHLAVLNDAEKKIEEKSLHDKKKLERKNEKKAAKDQVSLDGAPRKRVYVLSFEGNMNASSVVNLREEISAVLTTAKTSDEVLLRLESAGGMVHSYGLAASQLDRLRKKDIPITVSVDKVAASGGYMMACVADQIIAAPFAVLGSIGVVAQLPNFNRVLKHNKIDFELLTAGEYKRTLTLFGENTAKGREKFVNELEETHQLFKQYVSERREKIEIDQIATGEVWYGSKALELGLVDDLKTSDEYLISSMQTADVLEVKYILNKSLTERLGISAENAIDTLLVKWWQRLTGNSHNLP